MSFVSGFRGMTGLAPHNSYPSLGMNAEPKHTGVSFLYSCKMGLNEGTEEKHKSKKPKIETVLEKRNSIQ